MGMLSDFIIANVDEAKAYDGSDFADEDRLEGKHVTPLEAGAIAAVLRGGGDALDAMNEFDLISPQDAEQWCMTVPDDFVPLLAALDDTSIAEKSKQLAEATAEELGWSPADFVDFLGGLSALARRARERELSMFLWNSM